MIIDIYRGICFVSDRISLFQRKYVEIVIPEPKTVEYASGFVSWSSLYFATSVQRKFLNVNT